MFTIVGVIVALIGAFVQSRRHRHRPAADIHMPVQWMVLIVKRGIDHRRGIPRPRTCERPGRVDRLYARATAGSSNGRTQWADRQSGWWLDGVSPAPLWLMTTWCSPSSTSETRPDILLLGGGEQHQPIQHRRPAGGPTSCYSIVKCGALCGQRATATRCRKASALVIELAGDPR